MKSLAKVMGMSVVKAPSLKAAHPLSPFLETLLNAENALFFRAFEEMGVPPEEYPKAQVLPTGLALANFMLAVAHEGSFAEIVTMLLATEWTYYDWASRLDQAGKHPPQGTYQEWIESTPPRSWATLWKR